jgi:hypothetical protein
MPSLGASWRCFFSGASQAYAPRFSHSQSICSASALNSPADPAQSALTFRRDIVSRRSNACVGETIELVGGRTGLGPGLVVHIVIQFPQRLGGMMSPV